MSEVAEWKATVMLCDFAQVAEGKLYIVGGGWSLCGPGPFQHALAIKIEVPWGEANIPHRLEAFLSDEDNRQVRFGSPEAPIRFEGTFEVGRPVGLPSGTPLDFVLAVNMGPLELPPASGFLWTVTVDGKEVGRVRFRTRPK